MVGVTAWRWKGARHFLLSPPLCLGRVQPRSPIPNWAEACLVFYHRGRVCQTQDLWSLERPRFYLLNREEGRSFGFHLQQQRGRAGHVVCRVEPGASAQRQGLREGDRILGVNNHVVEHEDYSVVIRRIRASGPRVLLTVLAQHVHEVALAQQGNDAHLCPTLGRGVRPRLCHVVKDEGGFGFSITQGHRGPFWLVLSTGGAAERAGVPPGARLLEVNGVSVEKFTHNQLSKKLWQSGKQVTLLVAGPEVEEQCRQLGMPLAAPLAEGWALPTKPRCLHLEKGPQGFGFMLREEKGLDGRLGEWEPWGRGWKVGLGVGTQVYIYTSQCTQLYWGSVGRSSEDVCIPGQFLWEVDPGLPAEKAGMQAGDRLVAVAGESVEGLGHEETVTDAPGTLDLLNHLPLDKSSSASLPEPQYTQQTFPWCYKLYIPPFHQVTLGGSAARAGLQMGDVILEVNGYPMGGENDLERLQQLAEAEPPLCLKLAARSQQGLEAWIPPGSGEDWAVASDLL
ncbi:hypothetical protein E2I00_008589 [Balaenoptera physalus]|uniref:PDZ domain-containing protein n=1 Tax=Balaenoptera physalus TaxID=9770 RepID=A0A643BPS0_BALPH|nr:hypothetical protein E2I00_008589 [Balaenoptera physalus]